jgi:hypothetical protein
MILPDFLPDHPDGEIRFANYEAKLELQQAAAPKGTSPAELTSRLEALQRAEKT